VVNAASSQEDAIRRTFTHEYGHHVHMTAAAAGAKDFDSVLRAAYETLVPKAAAVLAVTPSRVVRGIDAAEGAASVYGTQNHAEFWAEAFAAYHHEAAWLKAHKPDVFDLVGNLLQYLRDAAR
jgi:hypothetical protein